MIGPAIAAAVVAGAGTTFVLAGPRWREQIHDGALRRAEASEAMRRDLAAADEDAPVWIRTTTAAVATAAVAGVAFAVLVWGTVGPLALIALPAGGVLAWAVRRRRLSRSASEARAALRLAALELAELVSLALGAGLGVAAALERAAEGLSGVAGARLASVSHRGPEPWSGIEALGTATGIHELSDLGRTLSVGVERQARTREVLLGWAQALRAAQLEEAEAAAGAATEAMTGPLALVAFGFLLAVGVPSVLQLLSGVSGVRL